MKDAKSIFKDIGTLKKDSITSATASAEGKVKGASSAKGKKDIIKKFIGDLTKHRKKRNKKLKNSKGKKFKALDAATLTTQTFINPASSGSISDFSLDSLGSVGKSTTNKTPSVKNVAYAKKKTGSDTEIKSKGKFKLSKKEKEKLRN